MNQTIYKDTEKNAIRFSEFNKLESDCPFTGLGVKYVASGEEIYYANNKKFRIKEGDYIIGNDFTKSIVQINNKHSVQGLCIDISSKIISEVAEFHDLNGTDLKDFLLSEQFFVNRYNIKNTSLGYTLNEINNKIKSGLFINDLHENELFYSLAESIITDQRFVFNHLIQMEFKKYSTNTDVFRAMLEARSIIDEHLTDNLSLDEISFNIGISKYHFLRVFKNTFGVSPYQYQKRKKLEFAFSDLKKGNDIFETAIRFGYPDVQSFSKAFKLEFGQTPGSVRKNNF
jgi:AraC family transcriptional regulator